MLEAGNAPAGLDLGKFGRYEVKIGYAAQSAKITYAREFELFAAGLPVKYYAGVKALFEEVSDRDNHTLTFHTTVAPPNGVPPAGLAPGEKKE